MGSDDENGWRDPRPGKHPRDGGWRTPGAGKDKSSDDSGGWRTPGTGKDKSYDDGLGWTEKLFDENSDAIGDGSYNSAEEQELWASLLDEPNMKVDAKNSVGDPEKKRLRDADDDNDDDDDCVILDADPEKAVVVTKEEGPRQDAVEDELQIVAEKGELACRDFPHPRHLCASFSFSTSSHASHCSMCHCYVCDSPAPCAFWGKGTGIYDHCHATDKDPKWKKLRQLSKHKSQQAPKLDGVQNLLQSSPRSVNLMIPSNGRFPASTTVSQIQQIHASIMVSQNTGQGIFQPRAPSPWRRTTIPSSRWKRARFAPPISTPSNVNYVQHSSTSYRPMQPALPRGFQTAQVPQGDTYWSSPYVSPSAPPPLSAPDGPQLYQRQKLPYPLVSYNTVVGTGAPLSQCTSLSTQGKLQGPSADTTRALRDALTNLANELGVPDYNIGPPVGQQSAISPSQTLCPNLVPGAKAGQGDKINPIYVAGQDSSQIRPSSRHNSLSRASGSTVVSSDAIQTKQPWC